MTCPKCKCEKIYTYDSRPGLDLVMRRKKCRDCGYRFKTMEISEERYKEIMEQVDSSNMLACKMVGNLIDVLSMLKKEIEDA